MQKVEVALEVQVDGAPLFSRTLVSEIAVDHQYPIRQLLPSSGSGGGPYDIFQALQIGEPRIVILTSAGDWTLKGFAAANDDIAIRGGGLLALVDVKAGFLGAQIEIESDVATSQEFFGFVAGVK